MVYISKNEPKRGVEILSHFNLERVQRMKVIHKPESKIVNSFLEVDMSEMRVPGIVVYKNPEDFPGVFVARLFEMAAGNPTTILIKRDTLEKIRKDVDAAGFTTQLKRSENDAKSIVETWL